MSLYKRDNVWWIHICQQGKRIRKSTGTSDKKAAQRAHDQIKADLWKGNFLKEKPSYLWMDAVVRWLAESQHKKSLADDKAHLRWLDQYLRNYHLSEINRDLIEQIITAKLNEGVRPSTVNRMMEILRAILRKAEREWEWLEKAPAIRMLKEENHRIRWITKEEAERLILNLPAHLADMASFALLTGLRMSNITGLKWENLDLVRRHAWVHPDQAKAQKAIPVPLNVDAINVIWKQIGKHHEYVFSYRGKPVSKCNTKAWKKALQKTGIDNFRWHDLRHTWASWHVQNGTSLQELQQLGGWASFEMVLRYAHLSSDHLREAAERICDTKLTQCHLKVVGNER